MSMVGWPGWSAYAKWDMMPRNRIDSSACALANASKRSRVYPAGTPLRFSPVSTLMDVIAWRPVDRAAASSSPSCPSEDTATSTSACSAAA
ncbi:Uncharacterised protein [Mycobacteroides abscessus subsp. abscessus]|nr:Uncharacterised protein [Mycobacteroides abscessus subsp. abscessus]